MHSKRVDFTLSFLNLLVANGKETKYAEEITKIYLKVKYYFFDISLLYYFEKDRKYFSKYIIIMYASNLKSILIVLIFRYDRT
jgi:hypothetical protein